MIVESCFLSGDKDINETETGATSESRAENEEGAVVGSWFVAKNEDNNRPGDGTNSESRIIAEEDEAIVGSWFWAGDETHFESDPSPVYRAISKSRCSVDTGPRAGRRLLFSSSLAHGVGLASHPQAPLDFQKKQHFYSLKCLEESQSTWN